jgi:hypothetical protein
MPRSRQETLSLIERLEGRTPRSAATVSRSAAAPDCPECQKLAVRYNLTPAECARTGHQSGAEGLTRKYLALG